MNLKKPILAAIPIGLAALAVADLYRSKGLKKDRAIVQKFNTRYDSTNYPIPKKIGITNITRLPITTKTNEVYTMVHPRGKQAVIIAPNTASPIAVEHELGHVKAEYYKHHPSKALRALGFAHKPTFIKTKIKAEEDAWSHVPPSANKYVLKRHALDSYEKSFHKHRGLAATMGAAITGAPYLLNKIR